jgi:lipopolysaccharide transport system permease protein
MNIKFFRKISPNPKPLLYDLKDIFSSKFLIYEFVKKEFIGAYSQTILGPSYFIFLPLIQSVVFNFFIKNLNNSTMISGVPTFIFFLLSTTLWNYFYLSSIKNSGVFLLNRKIIIRVSVNKLIFFISSSLITLSHLVINLVIMFLVIYVYSVLYGDISIVYSLKLLLIPLIIIYILFLSLFIGIAISSISIKYRDIIYGLPFLLNMLFFLSPILYAVDSKSNFYFLFFLNPISFPLEFFRWCFLDNYLVEPILILVNIIIFLFLGFFSLFFFKKVENKISDVI